MTPAFLPFTPNGRATEHAAIAVKKHLGLGPDQAVDPFDVLPDVPARLIDVALLDPELLLKHANGWSGIGFGCIGQEGEELIGLNPTHSEKRQRATLMEEIVHIVLDHPKTTLTVTSGGLTTIPEFIHDASISSIENTKLRGAVDRSARTFSNQVEDDAFNVGAACIIPYRHLFDAVHKRQEHLRTIAARFNVSEDLVTYRIKRAGLSKVYGKHNGKSR